jgi:hypothetical protein
MLCVVIGRVNMMSIRTFLLGGMTAAFAVGGFAIGNYRPAPQEAAPLEIRMPDYSRVPKSRLGVVIKENQKRLRLTDAQVRKVEAVIGPALQKEIARSRSRWEKRVITAEKISTGEWLPWNTEFSWQFTMEEQKGAVYGQGFAWFGATFDYEVRPKVKAVIGKKAIDQVIAISGKQFQEDWAKAFVFAMQPETRDLLHLSPLQQKQFDTLQKRVSSFNAKQNPKHPKGYPLLPEPLVRSLAMQMVFGLLDMKQALVLERLIWDEISVKP